jgi:uroporphyrinogen decarboxylase
MNARALISNMISKAQFDRVAIYEGFWDETLEVWVEQGYPTETIISDGRERTVPIDPFHHFPYDLHRCGGFFDTEPLFGYEEILEETDKWEVRRDGAGATFKRWKNKSGTPEHIDFKMTSRDIWERDYRPHLLGLKAERFNGKWWGDRTLEEDRLEYLWARSRNQWTWVGHVFLWEVIASPKTLRDLFLPYYAEIVSFFNDEYGLPVLFHSDGKLHQALPMILEAGFVGLHPLERKAGCDLIEFADKYGDQLIFIGGLDVRILETNDRELIKREIKQLLEAMKTRQVGYVFGSDHTITPTVRYDTYRFALDTYMEHRHF